VEAAAAAAGGGPLSEKADKEVAARATRHTKSGAGEAAAEGGGSLSEKAGKEVAARATRHTKSGAGEAAAAGGGGRKRGRDPQATDDPESAAKKKGKAAATSVGAAEVDQECSKVRREDHASTPVVAAASKPAKRSPQATRETSKHGEDSGGSQSQGSSIGSKRDLTKQGVVVAFSGFEPDETRRLKTLVQTTLKGRVEDGTDVSGCTHVVVVRPVKRTVKLCVAISQPTACLVTDDWIKACESAKSFVETTPYLLSGEHSSSKAGWSFNATIAGKRAAEGRCLGSKSFYITPNKAPKTRFSDSELASIIEAAGGTVLSKPPANGGAQTIVVSTEAERKAWEPLARMRNVTTLRADHLLTCVLRQELSLAAGKLT
jgi:hypothetical protein